MKNSLTGSNPSYKWLLILLGAFSIILIVNTSFKKDKARLAPTEKERPMVTIIPNDGKDDTRAIQNAIDKAAINGRGIVTLPAGDYNVNADSTINLRSNVTLSMAEATRLIVAPNTKQRYYVIKISNVENVKVLGGQVIGERDKHIGTTGEWGYGISITGSSNVLVKNTRVSNCWGDGFGIGGLKGNPSANITLKGVVSDNNRRQGLSVFDVNGLVIDSCQFSNTNGTLPMDGIDIEPDKGIAENITITSCRIFGNKGNGVETNAKRSTTAIIRNSIIQNNEIFDNAYSAYCQNSPNTTFTNNWLYGNKYGGNKAHLTNCPNSVTEPNTYMKP